MLFLRDGSFQFILTGLFGLTYIVGHFENLITWEFPDQNKVRFISTNREKDPIAERFEGRF